MAEVIDLISNSLILFLSIFFWNLAFFGNNITAWLVIPAIGLFIWIPISQGNLNLWRSFKYGTIWGTLCFSPQFWWLIRAAHLHSTKWGLANGYAVFFLFTILYSVSTGFFAVTLSFFCSFFKRFKHNLFFQIPTSISICFLYFIYIANYSFTPLGVCSGYPFLWPFLPLARSSIFIKTLAWLRQYQPENNLLLKSNINSFEFIHIPKNPYFPEDGVEIYPEFIGAKICRELEFESSRTNKHKIPIFCAPEGTFQFPYNSQKEIVNSWIKALPDNANFVIGTERKLSETKKEPMNWAQHLITGNSYSKSNRARTALWINKNRKQEQFFDKLKLCPFTEKTLCPGQTNQPRSIEISGVNFVPVICFDFFSQISWLSKIDSEKELTILLANESWFPLQTIELIYNFALITSAWYNKPVVYVSPVIGLKLISFSNFFEKIDNLLPFKAKALPNQNWSLKQISKINFREITSTIGSWICNLFVILKPNKKHLDKEILKALKKKPFKPFFSYLNDKVTPIKHKLIRFQNNDSEARAFIQLAKNLRKEHFVIKIPAQEKNCQVRMQQPNIFTETESYDYAKLEASRELASTIIAQSIGVPINHVELLEKSHNVKGFDFENKFGTIHSFLPFASLMKFSFYRGGPKIHKSLFEDLKLQLIVLDTYNGAAEIHAMDTFVCNFDRHPGNILYDPAQDQLHAIDMGESFAGQSLSKTMQNLVKESLYKSYSKRMLKALQKYKNTLKKLLFLWKPNQVHDFFINIVSRTSENWTDEELSNDFCEELNEHLKLMKQSYKDTEKLVELIDEFITIQRNRQLEAKKPFDALTYALPVNHSLQLYRC
jgi:hypothetical protein